MHELIAKNPHSTKNWVKFVQLPCFTFFISFQRLFHSLKHENIHKFEIVILNIITIFSINLKPTIEKNDKNQKINIQ